MSAIKYKRIFNNNGLSSGAIIPGTNINIVNNYSALPSPGLVTGQFFWVSNTQGTKWLPGSLGGTFYNKGIYYSNGVSWEYIDVPYQATQANVNAGIITDQFVSPATLKQTMQLNTGAWTYAGITIASTTTVDVGAATGWIVDNETTPSNSTQTYVNYPGQTGLTVTTIGSGTVTYVLLKMVAGVPTIHFQNTYPTSAQRKTMIYLSKLSHPASTVLTIKADEVDFITSPLQQFRDLFQVFNYINIGLTATANAALNFNTTAGTLLGDGINFVTDSTNPNHKTVAAQAPCSFLPLNQSGAASPFTTTFDPTTYDVAGVTTAIPGSPNQATIQYLYYSPGIGYGIQRGQTIYATLSDAIQQINKEVYIVRPNLVSNAIKIGVWVTTKGCTSLSNTSTSRFIAADMFGQLLGAGAGITLSTLQSAYNNAVDPEILTDSARGAVTIKRGSASDTDNIIEGQNGAGTNTFIVNGNGDLTSTTTTGILNKYDTLCQSYLGFVAGATANTYFLTSGGTWSTSNGLTTSGTATAVGPGLIYIDAADYPTINGITPKLRIRAGIFTNATAPTGNFTFGLYPLTAPGSAGGAASRSWTIGTVVTGSNGATQTTPAANTNYSLTSSDFILPATGYYAVCVVTTGTIAVGAYAQCTATLQLHNQ